MAVPLLTTSRLTLRPVRRADAAVLHAHWTDASVRRYLWDDAVIPETQVAALIAESAARFETYGHGLWALRLREASGLEGVGEAPASEGLVGCGGLWPFHTPPRLELVLSLDLAFQRRGLAAEAGRALLAYARDALGMAEALASTDAPNAAAQRLLERLGFQFTHRSGDSATLFYARRLGEARGAGLA